MYKNHSVRILFSLVFLSSLLLLAVCYNGMSPKDLRAANIVHHEYKNSLDIALEPSYSNEIDSDSLVGERVISNAGVVLDKKMNLKLEDLITHPEWFELLSDFRNRNFPSKTVKKYWIRYDLKNISNKDLEFYLLSSDIFFKLEEIYYYNPMSSRWMASNVNDYNRAVLPLNFDRSPLFPINLKAGEEGVVVVAAKSMINKIEIKLIDTDARSSMGINYNFQLAILIGGIVGLIIFNFLLYLSTGDKIYILYTSYKISFVILILFISVIPGWYSYISNPSLYREAISWGLGAIVNSLALIFSMRYLDLQHWNKTLYNIGLALVTLATSLVLCMTIFMLFNYYSIQATIIPNLVKVSLAISVFILIIGAAGIYKGRREAYPYSLAWIVMVLTNIITTLSGMSLISVNTPIDILLACGGFIEACLLSFGLGQKMNDTSLSLFAEKERRILSEQEAKVVGEVLKISSEVHSFERIDNIFSLVLESFNNLFPNLGFGIVMEPNRTDQIIFSKFSALDENDVTLIEQRHHRVLAISTDEAILKKHPESYASYTEKQQVQDILAGGDWTVFAGVVYAKSISKGITHRLKLFVKGDVSDLNLKIIQILFDQIMGLARMKFQADELEKVVNTDALTGAYNRFYFDKAMEHFNNQMEIQNTQYCIVFCDINGLKKVNDEHGHKAGDSLICGAVELIDSVCRETDLLFRLGGDEIVIFCPETTNETGCILIRRIEERLKSSAVKILEDVEHIVSLSFGVADSSEGKGDDLVELADKRMFEKKNEYYKEADRYR